LKKDTIDRLFPQAASTGPLSGKPPAIPVYGAGGRIGFLFSTAELTDVVGFSGAPFNFVVGLDLQGKIVGVVLVEHHEPIIDYNHMGAQLTRFIEQYAGLDLGGSISLSGQGTPGGIDGISSATVSARRLIMPLFRAPACGRSADYGWRRVGRHDRYASFEPLTWSGSSRLVR
jgi:NosR/NirI family nitrous oxide reductase transcriptional regulator